MGGRHAFANGDWAGTEIEKLLPMKLDARGQVEGEVKLKPTDKGLEYLLRLADRPAVDRNAHRRPERLFAISEFGVDAGLTSLYV